LALYNTREEVDTLTTLRQLTASPTKAYRQQAENYVTKTGSNEFRYCAEAVHRAGS
jgi:hypothetical protein